MALRTRITVLSFFSVRILFVLTDVPLYTIQTVLTCCRAIAATICQLVYLPRVFETDFTLRGFPYYLSMQFAQFASISAACAAYFWPFLRSLRSGLISADNRAFTSQYALSKLRGSARNDTSGELVSGDSSKNRDRSNYIKITTDNTVITSTRGQNQGQGSGREEALGSEGYMKDW